MGWYICNHASWWFPFVRNSYKWLWSLYTHKKLYWLKKQSPKKKPNTGTLILLSWSLYWVHKIHVICVYCVHVVFSLWNTCGPCILNMLCGIHEIHMSFISCIHVVLGSWKTCDLCDLVCGWSVWCVISTFVNIISTWNTCHLMHVMYTEFFCVCSVST